MVSGSYGGASIKVNDWLLVGAIAVGGYLLYKTLWKPVGDVTGAVGDVATRGGEALGSGFDIFNTLFDKINDGVANIGEGAQPIDYGNIKQVTFNDSIQSITDAGEAYGTPLVTARTSSGKSSTIAAAKNTYYPTLNIGFDQYGQGYSAAGPVSYPNKLPVTTVPGKANKITSTKSSTATDIFTKKAYS